MRDDRDIFFLRKAIALAEEGMNKNGGGPFGALIVRNGEIVGQGYNHVTATNDPTAHAEVAAIRNACQNLNTYVLDDCTIYTSCEPCPMCLGAIYWARLQRVVYASERKDAAHNGFDDKFIYDEIEKEMDQRKIEFVQLLRDEGLHLFKQWEQKEDKTHY